MVESVDDIRKALNESAFVFKYNTNDIRRANTQDWWIQDFLTAEKGDIKAAAALFVACLQWREAFGVQGIGALELSDALAENFIYFHGCDLEGRNILWLNWSRYQFITTRRTAERLLVYWLERHSMETCNALFTFNVNFHGSDIRDIDLDFVEFIFTCINEYYPGSVEQILLYEVPASIWTKWQDFASTKQRAFCSFVMANVDRVSIGSYVPFKYLPLCMSGEDDYVFVMNGLPQCIYSRQNKKLDGDFVKSLSKDLSFVGNSKKTVTFKNDDVKNDNNDANGGTMTTLPSTSNTNSFDACDKKPTEDTEFLGISENDLLVLKHSEKGDYIAQLSLENRSRSGCQLFKVKTTAPQKFRVRPTLGVIPAGERQTICIVLDKAYETSYRSERFLISTILMNNVQPPSAETLQDFANLFAEAKPEETFQIKLNCVMEGDDAKSNEQLTVTNDQSSVMEKLKSVDRELALFLAERELIILKQVNSIRQQLNITRVVIVVIILLQAMMFLYFMKELKNARASTS